MLLFLLLVLGAFALMVFLLLLVTDWTERHRTSAVVWSDERTARRTRR
jgi:hypothetical protein